MHIILLILKIIAIVLLVLLAFFLTGLLMILFVPVRYYGKFTTKGDVFKTLDFERINFVLDVYWFFKLVHLRLELRKMKLNLFLRAGWVKLIEKGKIQGMISGDEEDEGAQPDGAQSEEPKAGRSKKKRFKIGRLRRRGRKKVGAQSEGVQTGGVQSEEPQTDGVQSEEPQTGGVQSEEAQTGSQESVEPQIDNTGSALLQTDKTENERLQTASVEITEAKTCVPDSTGVQTDRLETAGLQNDRPQTEKVKADNTGSSEIQSDKAQKERPKTDSAESVKSKTCVPDSTGVQTDRLETAGSQNESPQTEGVKADNAGSAELQADKTENERPQTDSAEITEPKTTSPESTESKTASAESAGPKPDLIAAVKEKLEQGNKAVHDEDDDGSDLFDEMKEGLRRLKNRAVSVARKAYDSFQQTKQQAAERVQGVLQMSTEQGQNLPQQLFDLLYDAYLWIDGKVDDLDRQFENLQNKKEKQETFFGWTNRSYYSWVLRSVWEMLRHVRVRNLRGHLRFGTWRPDITGVIGGVFWTILSPDEQGFDLEPDFYMTKSEPGSDSDVTDHDAEAVDQLMKLDADFDFYGHFRFCFAALLALRIACSRDTWMMLKKYKNRRRQNNG